MDWSNEEYVRLYVRETAADLELSWGALALWRALMTKFDRAGIIPIKHGWTSVSRLTRIPEDIVIQVGPELIRDGRLVMTADSLFAPNFTEAQTAIKSDKARQRESRDRRRQAAKSAATNSTHNVNTSQNADDPLADTSSVTPGHARVTPVTLALASLSHAYAPADCARDTSEAEPVEPAQSSFDPENLTQRRQLVDWCWTELGKRRQAVTRELGLASTPPLPPITPGSYPRSVSDLRQRIIEEGANAPSVCLFVLESATADARTTRSINFLGEKLFTEGGWRTARERVPKWRDQQPKQQQGHVSDTTLSDGTVVRQVYAPNGDVISSEILSQPSEAVA